MFLRDLTLPFRFHRVLKAIHDFIKEFGTSPYRTNAWIREETGYESNHITQIKRGLKKLGYITEQTYLTPKGQEYIRIHFGPFLVRGVEIRVQGEVTAGPGDEMIVDLENLEIPSNETITVPSVSTDKDTFALRVNGISMVREGILDGDYVIVEKLENWWPDPQDMIVTNYLPSNPALDPTIDYIGPVLKVYVKRVGETGCELGWRRANEINPFTITAWNLRPVGKVIGVYRDINKFSWNIG